jgi:uncharacterized membrane protein YheB (UPF0754 family)
MPYLSIDLEIDEIVDSFSKREIEKLIDYLIDCEHLPPLTKSQRKVPNALTYSEEDFIEKVDKLINNRLSLTSEELAQIEKIANRF